MANQIMVIAPYWVENFSAWVFDDPKVGLEQEPFVSGVTGMMVCGHPLNAMWSLATTCWRLHNYALKKNWAFRQWGSVSN